MVAIPSMRPPSPGSNGATGSPQLYGSFTFGQGSHGTHFSEISNPSIIDQGGPMPEWGKMFLWSKPLEAGEHGKRPGDRKPKRDSQIKSADTT